MKRICRGQCQSMTAKRPAEQLPIVLTIVSRKACQKRLNPLSTAPHLQLVHCSSISEFNRELSQAHSQLAGIVAEPEQFIGIEQALQKLPFRVAVVLAVFGNRNCDAANKVVCSRRNRNVDFVDWFRAQHDSDRTGFSEALWSLWPVPVSAIAKARAELKTLAPPDRNIVRQLARGESIASFRNHPEIMRRLKSSLRMHADCAVYRLGMVALTNRELRPG